MKVMESVKEVQESSKMAKLFFNNNEDLDDSSLEEILCKLSLIRKEIEYQWTYLQYHKNQLKVDDIRDLTIQQSPGLYSMSSKNPPPPPRYWPWTPFQPSLQLQQPSIFCPLLAPFPSSQPLEQQLPHIRMQKNNLVELPKTMNGK
ncbi:hypothetical protein ACP4OV_020599 [Aristida adscensionis]